MTTVRNAGSDLTLPAYVLAGGRSRRFGSDKARAVRDGVPLVVSVAQTLAPFASSVTVVSRSDGEYDDLGLRTIGDVIPARGPLGGLLTALRDCGISEWILVCACDWVGVRASWLRVLLEADRRGVDAVVYRTDRFEPLLALYGATIAPRVERAVEGEDRSFQSLLNASNTRTLPVPPDWQRGINLNHPGDGNSDQ